MIPVFLSIRHAPVPCYAIRQIESIESLDDLIVTHLTYFDDLNLPTSALATFDDASTDYVSINWVEGSYDPEVPGTYPLVGNPVEAYGIKNDANIQASINVIVQSAATIVAHQMSLSNKFVDLYFSDRLFADNEHSTAITTSDIEIFDFFAGGVSAISIASVKRANHYLSASATNLSGGESVIRVFLTLTGTPDGTETFKIRPVSNSVFNQGGFPIPTTEATSTIEINLTPLNAWNHRESSSVTVTSLGASTVADIMGNMNWTQATDADRPAYLRQSTLSFDRSNSEFLGASSNATYSKQQGDNFAVLMIVKPNMGTDSGWIFANFNGSNNNGWTIRAGSGGGGGVQFLMFDNTTANQAIFANFEDQKGALWFVNESGVLSIYDENGNRVGSQGTTSISTITYTGITPTYGRRLTQTTNFFNGEVDGMWFFNSAPTSGQRNRALRNLYKTPANRVATITKCLYPVLNGSIVSSHKDTMQCFLGDVILKDGTYYMFYSANAADGDIDRGFLATKSSNTPFEPFTKVLDSGAPKVILAPSGVNGEFDEDEVLIRSVFWDEDQQHYKIYYTANQIGASPQYTTGLATAVDPENPVKQGQVYTDGTTNIIFQCVCKAGTADYRSIVNTSATGGDTNNFSYDYLTSVDGVLWTKVGNINSLFSGIILILNLQKVGDRFFMVCTADGRDSDSSAGSKYVIYATYDFVTSEYMGELFAKHEPSERCIGGISFVQTGSAIEVFYTYFKNQNKTASNGGEAYTAMRMAVLNIPLLQQPIVEVLYPPWVKKYWPLNAESVVGGLFTELIDEDSSSSFAGVLQWSLDGLNFFDFLGTGLTFPNNGLIFSATDFALKMRVEIITTGTINLFSCGTDIVVQLVSGNLRVALNNATKDYITTADIAKPSGITDPGNHVYVGFIWQGGTLRLCVGNTVGISVTQTVNNAMTNISNSGSDVLICSGSTIEAARVIAMSGQTDQQWIDTDL